jgi:hypothetical protein
LIMISPSMRAMAGLLVAASGLLAARVEQC